LVGGYQPGVGGFSHPEAGCRPARPAPLGLHGIGFCQEPQRGGTRTAWGRTAERLATAPGPLLLRQNTAQASGLDVV
jgi:hypothetical protein